MACSPENRHRALLRKAQRLARQALRTPPAGPAQEAAAQAVRDTLRLLRHHLPVQEKP